MKRKQQRPIPTETKEAVHIAGKEILQPPNPVSVNLIGAGGTGSMVLFELAKIDHTLRNLDEPHPGLHVRLFDDDEVTRANLGRQPFATAELGLCKSVALINRTNLFFGTNWKAVTEKYDRSFVERNEHSSATITISCVDTVSARFGIAEALAKLHKAMRHYRNAPLYWMDFGNSRDTAQVILSTVHAIPQPESAKYRTVDRLPFVTEEFKDLLISSEAGDPTPSCSLAQALTKQNLFINPGIAVFGASLLWTLFSEGLIFNRGFFLNMKEGRCQPLKV